MHKTYFFNTVVKNDDKAQKTLRTPSKKEGQGIWHERVAARNEAN